MKGKGEGKEVKAQNCLQHSTTKPPRLRPSCLLQNENPVNEYHSFCYKLFHPPSVHGNQKARERDMHGDE